MIEQNNMKRNRHNEELMFDELTSAIETIDSVAAFTGKTFKQVADIYHTLAINRLTEVLIDAGDEWDRNNNDMRKFIKEELYQHRNWCYENQPLRIEIEKE